MTVDALFIDNSPKDLETDCIHDIVTALATDLTLPVDYLHSRNPTYVKSILLITKLTKERRQQQTMLVIQNVQPYPSSPRVGQFHCLPTLQ